MCWGQELGSRVRSGVASKSSYAGDHTIKICWSKPSYLMACSHMLHLGAKKPYCKYGEAYPLATTCQPASFEIFFRIITFRTPNGSNRPGIIVICH